jgi:hypothetical protein
MNRSNLKYTCEKIELQLNKPKVEVIGFMRHQNKIEYDVLEEIWKDQDHFTYKGIKYTIKFKPSIQTIGNRFSTAEFEVTKYKKKEKHTLDVDEILSNNVITVADWLGGTERISKFLPIDGQTEYEYDRETLSDIIDLILDTTDYNIMIQRHDSGDITVFIDHKRFTQR